MSVLIRNMEMPKSCGECKFFAWKRGVGNHCAIDESITFHPTLDGLDVRYEKNGNCPFISVPDHGRLIDADEFYKDINESILLTDGFKDAFNLWFDEQPTIIPAEEGADDV